MSKKIGVDSRAGLIIEEAFPLSYLLWPTPKLLSAKFCDESGNDVVNHQLNVECPYYFMEDNFDHVSRIRQGRFYSAVGRTGQTWRVQPHPYVSIPYHNIEAATGVLLMGSLSEYTSWELTCELDQYQLSNLIIRLGNEKAATLWQVIHLETGFTGEQLVTLKARQSFGALPEVNWNRVPEAAGHAVRERMDGLEDEYHRAGVESVVDRAREAATAILSAFLQSEGKEEAKGKDLGDLTKLLEKHSGQQGRKIITSAAWITARLHARGKHAEQEARGVRELREQDAQLAVQCVGVILCDLGWAEWR